MPTLGGETTARSKRQMRSTRTHLLPTGIVAGFPRCGTTWLHALIQSADQAFVPSERKEIYYFDRNWHRGVEWYSQWFRSAEGCERRVDITPTYAQELDASVRIAATLGEGTRVVLILRQPVNRLWSEYHHFWRTRRGLGDFRRWAGRSWHRSVYAPKVSTFMDTFGSNLKVVLYEDLMHRVRAAQEVLEHLEITLPVDVVEQAMSRPVNPGFEPRLLGIHRAMHGVLRAARSRHVPWIDRVANVARDAYLRLASDARRKDVDYATQLPSEDRELMAGWFTADVNALSRLLDRDLHTFWAIPLPRPDGLAAPYQHV